MNFTNDFPIFPAIHWLVIRSVHLLFENLLCEPISIFIVQKYYGIFHTTKYENEKDLLLGKNLIGSYLDEFYH